MKSTLAKIFGWAFFGLQTISQMGQQGGTPHGWAGWLGVIASGAMAVAVHASSNTAGNT
jgi:hypothetical protein